MSNNNNFFNPKSVFKGTNADGTKFKMAEWDANSIGNIGGGGLISILLSALFLAIASPFSLVIGVFNMLVALALQGWRVGGSSDSTNNFSDQFLR